MWISRTIQYSRSVSQPSQIMDRDVWAQLIGLVLPAMNLTSFAESGEPPGDHIPKHRSFIASKWVFSHLHLVLHTVLLIPCTLHFTLCSLESSLHATLHSTSLTLIFAPLSSGLLLYTRCSPHLIFYSSLFTPCTLHLTLHTLYLTLSTLYSSPYNLHIYTSPLLLFRNVILHCLLHLHLFPRKPIPRVPLTNPDSAPSPQTSKSKS